MATYEAVSRERHKGRSWHRLKRFKIFSEERTAPLVAAEFPKAAVVFPIAWVKNADVYEPVALLGLEPRENLFVDAAGKWSGGYMPVHFRSQPFRLMADSDAQLTLAVREDEGLVTYDASGAAFFSEDGELTPEVADIVTRLRKVEANRVATKRATAALAEAGVLQPWEVKPVIRRSRQPLSGLYHVDQKRLNALDREVIGELRDKGALAMAYCQQVSQQLIQRVEMLHAGRAERQVQRSMHPADQGGFGLGDDEGISFGGMAGPNDEAD